jgi:hypothetical protein
VTQPDPEHLQELIDNFRVDELLELVSVEEIADAWWRYTGDPKAFAPNEDFRRSPNWWAVALWHDDDFLKREKLKRAGLVALAERAPEDANLGQLGAGPLEDFIWTDEETIAWVEEQAARIPNFKTALAAVWLAVNTPDWVWERLDRAAGVKLDRPS